MYKRQVKSRAKGEVFGCFGGIDGAQMDPSTRLTVSVAASSCEGVIRSPFLVMKSRQTGMIDTLFLGD